MLGGDQAGATGYWIDRSRYALPDLGLTADETPRPAAGRGHRPPGGGLGRRRAAEARAAPSAGARRATGRSWPRSPVARRRCPSCSRPTPSGPRCAFGYRGRRPPARSVRPAGPHGFWYVVGLDHGAGEVRTFRVDRIEGDVVRRPGGAFEIPAGFDLAATFPADAKMVGEGEVVSARVWISAAQAPTRRRASWARPRSPSAGPTAASSSRVPCANRRALRAWVLGPGRRRRGPGAARTCAPRWSRGWRSWLPARSGGRREPGRRGAGRSPPGRACAGCSSCCRG